MNSPQTRRDLSVSPEGRQRAPRTRRPRRRHSRRRRIPSLSPGACSTPTATAHKLSATSASALEKVGRTRHERGDPHAADSRRATESPHPSSDACPRPDGETAPSSSLTSASASATLGNADRETRSTSMLRQPPTTTRSPSADARSYTYGDSPEVALCDLKRRPRQRRQTRRHDRGDLDAARAAYDAFFLPLPAPLSTDRDSPQALRHPASASNRSAARGTNAATSMPPQPLKTMIPDPPSAPSSTPTATAPSPPRPQRQPEQRRQRAARTRRPDAATAAYDESDAIPRRLPDTYGDSPQALRDLSVSLNKVGNAQRERGDLTPPAAYDGSDAISRARSTYGDSPSPPRPQLSLTRSGTCNANAATSTPPQPATTNRSPPPRPARPTATAPSPPRPQRQPEQRSRAAPRAGRCGRRGAARR